MSTAIPSRVTENIAIPERLFAAPVRQLAAVAEPGVDLRRIVRALSLRLAADIEVGNEWS